MFDQDSPSCGPDPRSDRFSVRAIISHDVVVSLIVPLGVRYLEYYGDRRQPKKQVAFKFVSRNPPTVEVLPSLEPSL